MSAVGARQHPQFSGSGGGSRCSSDGRNSSGSGSICPSKACFGHAAPEVNANMSGIGRNRY